MWLAYYSPVILFIGKEFTTRIGQGIKEYNVAIGYTTQPNESFISVFMDMKNELDVLVTQNRHVIDNSDHTPKLL